MARGIPVGNGVKHLVLRFSHSYHLNIGTIFALTITVIVFARAALIVNLPYILSQGS